MKYSKMKKAPSPFSGGATYDSPYSNVKTGGDDGGTGYVAGGLDVNKVIPGKGKKSNAKPAKKMRRAY